MAKTLKAGDKLTGNLKSFRYVTSDSGKYCVANVADATDDTVEHQIILGTADEFSFPVMMSLKGQNVTVNFQFKEVDGKGYNRYNNVEFGL